MRICTCKPGVRACKQYTCAVLHLHPMFLASGQTVFINQSFLVMLTKACLLTATRWEVDIPVISPNRFHWNL